MAGVEVKLGGSWIALKRSANNQWPYYNTQGPWQSSFPMPIRITSAAGEVVEDSIPDTKGGDGKKQFSAVRGPLHHAKQHPWHGMGCLHGVYHARLQATDGICAS